MCAPAASCRKGTRRMPCSSSAASSGSISGEGRPKTKRTPSLARQRASSAPPFSSAIGHLLVELAALVPALPRGGPDVSRPLPPALSPELGNAAPGRRSTPDEDLREEDLARRVARDPDTGQVVWPIDVLPVRPALEPPPPPFRSG